MKKSIILFALAFFAISGYAEEKCGKDTTKIKMGKSTIVIYNSAPDEKFDFDFGNLDSTKKKDEKWKVVVDLGTNGYMAPDYQLSLPSGQELMEVDYSRSFSIGFTSMHKGANIIKDRLYVTSGLGFNWNNYSFENNININSYPDSTTYTANALYDYDKYKLKTAFIQVPVVIGARIGNLKTPLGIQAGVVGSYKIGSRIKEKFIDDEAGFKNKIKDDFNLNPFRLEAIARVTIGGVGFYGKYSITSLYEKNKAPELYPFSVGITFGDFFKNN